MIINTIYTSGTVSLLWPFSLSFLNKGLSLRIVTNGCTSGEFVFLKQKEKQHSNLEVFKLNNNKLLAHHEVLGILYHFDADEEYFCFIDSDIYCYQFPSDEIKDHLNKHKYLSSCPPIWSENLMVEKDFQKLQGRHFLLRNNEFVGGSYFTIYSRLALKEVMTTFKYGFDRSWFPKLNHNLQKILLNKGEPYLFERYDTCKILNILLNEIGCDGGYLDAKDNLLHIGGVSWNESIVKKRKKVDIVDNSKNERLNEVMQTRKLVADYFYKIINNEHQNRSDVKLSLHNNNGLRQNIERQGEKLIYHLNTI